MTTKIHCSYDVASPLVWYLEQPYTRETSIGTVTVAPPFDWDGASVPRVLWAFIPTWGSYSGAALVHDGLYATHRGTAVVTISARSTNTITRKEADRVFYELMLEDGALADKPALGEVGQSGWHRLRCHLRRRKKIAQVRAQRCWVHKTANVLNYLPKSVQTKAKADLHAIYEAASRAAAEAAFDRFLAKYQAKYEKAASCLAKDRVALLAFYDVPAEHWKHVRSTNPVESTFATVRLRTDKTKGCLSRQTALAMVFKLAKSAERHWRRLNGSDRLAEIVRGVRFRDGEPVTAAEEQAAA